MQVTIVGAFRSDSGFTIESQFQLDHGEQNHSICYLATSRQAIEKFDAGTPVDLVVCGPEIDMNGLIKSLEELGISPPVIIQPIPDTATGDDQMIGTRLDSDEDHSAWLGNENNPLRLGQSLCDVERNFILQTLTHCGGNRTYAADILGISSRTLRNKLQQYSASGCTVKPVRQSARSANNSSNVLLS